MDATEYIKILLDISVALVITVVLFVLARRARKEKTFVGFKKSSHDEKYAGYAMLAIGIAIIAVSIYRIGCALRWRRPLAETYPLVYPTFQRLRATKQLPLFQRKI